MRCGSQTHGEVQRQAMQARTPWKCIRFKFAGALLPGSPSCQRSTVTVTNSTTFTDETLRGSVTQLLQALTWPLSTGTKHVTQGAQQQQQHNMHAPGPYLAKSCHRLCIFGLALPLGNTCCPPKALPTVAVEPVMYHNCSAELPTMPR